MWSLLLNKAYVVKLSFGWPLPFDSPRGLWMTPYVMNVGIDSYLRVNDERYNFTNQSESVNLDQVIIIAIFI